MLPQQPSSCGTYHRGPRRKAGGVTGRALAAGQGRRWPGERVAVPLSWPGPRLPTAWSTRRRSATSALLHSSRPPFHRRPPPGRAGAAGWTAAPFGALAGTMVAMRDALVRSRAGSRVHRGQSCSMPADNYSAFRHPWQANAVGTGSRPRPYPRPPQAPAFPPPFNKHTPAPRHRPSSPATDASSTSADHPTERVAPESFARHARPADHGFGGHQRESGPRG